MRLRALSLLGPLHRRRLAALSVSYLPRELALVAFFVADRGA